MVASFIARLANRAPNSAFRMSGRSRRLVDVPKIALSNFGERASAGNEKRAFVATGTRSAGGDRGNVLNGLTTTNKAKTPPPSSPAVPTAGWKKQKQAPLFGAPRPRPAPP